MAKFLVEAPHTKETCLQALDEVAATENGLLEEFQWGCAAGVHDGWAILEAESEAALRKTLPASRRDEWVVTPVTQVTREQLEAYHR